MSGKYAVKDFIDPQQAVQDLEINQENISLSMMTHAGLFAYYSTLAAKAQLQADQLGQLQDVVMARLDQKVRDEATTSGKKLTEAQVKSKILLEPEAIQITTALNKAKMIAGICKSQTEALRQRKDLMVSIALTQREEKKGEARVHESPHEMQRNMRADQVERVRQSLSR